VSTASLFFSRWRVRIGYPIAAVVLLFAKPTPRSIVAGAVVGLLGLWLRACAAGFLYKHEQLSVTGPYSYTRNPLYLGSAILAIGAGTASRSWISAIILLTYFAVFYSFVMRKEETELRAQHGKIFEEYAKAVPLFFPRLVPAKEFNGGKASFSFAQYKKNR